MSELRRKILDASAALVAERGVRAVSFREVARRAGVSHQAPYHHFGNYAGILEAIAREGFAELTEAMCTAAQAAGPDPLDALSAVGTAYIEFARTQVGHFRVMFQRPRLEGEDALTPLEEAAQTHQALSRMCAAAKRAGYGSALSVDALTMLCWSTVHGFATLLVEEIVQTKHTRTADGAVRDEALTKALIAALAAVLR